MSWKTSLGLILAAAALLGACSGKKEPAISPRQQVQDPAAREMMVLRQENETLKQEQLQNARQLETLQKQLASDKDEQRRFREMMSTNFDLLEQSVALTMAKSAERGNATAQSARAAPVTAKAPLASPVPLLAPAMPKAGPSEAAAPGKAPAPAEAAAPLESMDPAESSTPKAVGQVRPGVPVVAALTPAARPAPGAPPQVRAMAPVAPANKAVVPAALGHEGPAIVDPDLTPPRNPKQLTANRAAKSLYERGFALFAGRQYDQSILVYQNFLSRYPEDIYSDNAQFWIGESYLRMDKLAEAEGAYRKVLKDYEHKNSLEGYKTPEVIYRLGLIAQKRSNGRLAKFYFNNVVERFPESSAGRKAKRELEGKPHTTAQSLSDDETAGG